MCLYVSYLTFSFLLFCLHTSFFCVAYVLDYVVYTSTRYLTFCASSFSNNTICSLHTVSSVIYKLICIFSFVCFFVLCELYIPASPLRCVWLYVHHFYIHPLCRYMPVLLFQSDFSALDQKRIPPIVKACLHFYIACPLPFR
jgi:hypothetical protein